MTRLAPLLALVALASACSTSGRETSAREGDKNEKSAVKQAALSTTTQRLAWSESGLGFMPPATERLARGPQAVAVDPRTGSVLVLDNVNGRVARLERGAFVAFASVPPDADDIAVGPDGAVAVRRSVKPEVLVFDRKGLRIGGVDTSAVEVDHITLLGSRRVAVTSPYQETFILGSPALPQLEGAVLASKREGAAQLPDGTGVVTVRRDDGELELRVLRGSQGAQTEVAARHALGHGSAAAIVGASGTIVCARIEHASDDATGAVAVTREAACVDTSRAATVLRVPLASPGTYVPRRELAFAGTTLAAIHPSADGLEITTWAVTAEGGTR